MTSIPNPAAEETNPFMVKFKVKSMGELEDVLAGLLTAAKLYYSLEGQLISQLNSPPLPSPTVLTSGDDPKTRYSAIERHLEAVLGYKEESVGIKKVNILAEALKHHKELVRHDQGIARQSSQKKESRRASRKAHESPGEVSKSSQISEPGNEKYNETAIFIIKALCHVNTVMAFDINGEESSAFQKAAEDGFTPVVEVMLRELQTEPPQDAIKLLSTQHKNKTALQLAAEKLRLGVIELLLNDYPSLANIESVMSTIAKTAPTETEQTRIDALKAFETISKAMGILDEESTSHDGAVFEQAVEISSQSVLERLLQKDISSKFCTYSNAALVIEKGNVDMWILFGEESQKAFMSEPGCDFLHKAVSYKKVGIVQDILRLLPSQIEANLGNREKPDYPLQHLNSKEKETDGTSTVLRDILLRAMIRSDNIALEAIRKILCRSKVEGKGDSVPGVIPQVLIVTDELLAYQMSLHLETVNTSENSFADYVKFLMSHKSSAKAFFKFESVLKYACFPDLSDPSSSTQYEDRRVDHREISDVFTWLKERGVENVLELSVLDRLDNPHSDDSVDECINGFDIRVLKWKKLDIYLGGIDDKTHLQELHLYSSGNRSVHDQWCEQLPNFPNLKTLSVKVVKDVMSDDRANRVESELSKRLERIRQCLEERRRLETSGERTDAANPPFILKIESWKSRKGFKISQTLEDIAIKAVWPTLDAFIHQFCRHYRLNIQIPRTKVALIDSGVVVFGGINQIHSSDSEILSKDLSYRIVDGISLVSKDNMEQLYWHASEPHGTQMARLICTINPCCELYVIKVAETRSSGVTANNVAAAIDWARERQVDVISLSLAVYGDPEGKMTEAIRLAKDADIVLVSSTADEGSRVSRTVPADQMSTNDILSIAACDWYGNLLDKSQKDGFNYKFVGHEVPVGLVPFLKSSESVTGSSVATALAAGTASLILACCRISTRCKTDGSASHWRGRMVAHILGSMSEGDYPQWVDLDNFCGKKEDLGETFDFEDFVDSNFEFGVTDGYHATY